MCVTLVRETVELYSCFEDNNLGLTGIYIKLYFFSSWTSTSIQRVALQSNRCAIKDVSKHYGRYAALPPHPQSVQ